MKIHKEVRQMPDKAINYMKTIDMIAATFLFVGGMERIVKRNGKKP